MIPQTLSNGEIVTKGDEDEKVMMKMAYQSNGKELEENKDNSKA